MLLAVLSTFISSIALIGVAVGLVLQARQLRANRLQVGRASQVELLRFCLDNPTIAADLGMGMGNEKTFTNGIFLNWYVSHLSTSFDIGTLSKANLAFLIGRVFDVEESRQWWALARQSYYDDITSRRLKAFFAIVDGEYRRANQISEAVDQGTVDPIT